MGGTVDGRIGDHVLLAPPYIATTEDIDMIVDRLGHAVDGALKLLVTREESEMKTIRHRCGLCSHGFTGASAATLDTVKQRGTLVCGVSAGFAGFSTPDSQGNYKGLDVDYCRALAAACSVIPQGALSSR